MAEGHDGFKRWVTHARTVELLRSRRRLLKRIGEHMAKLEESLADADPQPIHHLEGELLTFREQVEIEEVELRRRGVWYES